jgi:hypothetical protein
MGAFFLIFLRQMIFSFENPSEYIEALSHFGCYHFCSIDNDVLLHVCSGRSRTSYPWSSIRGPWKLFRA